ncbi:hypothetical protein FGU71_07450 [Erythrobacter insulae]|uniref:Uncharacterized protein n=1 Tax=Erythrobacter insulae TaxID=2584124 RepID=A0A547PC75_9SPHN|nr:hypothetical protein [Erythrobacter insulae]TRD11715.1 hypothetical protein FGU71_07450 [Erythrobacter insulae]
MVDFDSRLEAIERKNRFLSRIAIVFALIAVALAIWHISPASPAKAAGKIDVLQLRTLEIVDATGTVRARLGSDLPDAIIDGKTVGRGGEKVSGLMLYDGTGQERGGYVTFEPSGNIGLTLDTRKGQVALFAAGPQSGANLRLWDGEDAIELRADQDGTRLTSVQDGVVAVQLPVIEAIGPEACNAYRGAKGKLPREEIIKACTGRFPSELCQRCLAE